MQKLSKYSNVETKSQIDALNKFNYLKNKIPEVEFYDDLEDSLHYLILIYKPLKMHIFACHVKEFIHDFGKSKLLGSYSEQANEIVYPKLRFSSKNFSLILIESSSKHI